MRGLTSSMVVLNLGIYECLSRTADDVQAV